MDPKRPPQQPAAAAAAAASTAPSARCSTWDNDGSCPGTSRFPRVVRLWTRGSRLRVYNLFVAVAATLQHALKLRLL